MNCLESFGINSLGTAIVPCLEHHAATHHLTAGYRWVFFTAKPLLSLVTGRACVSLPAASSPGNRGESEVRPSRRIGASRTVTLYGPRDRTSWGDLPGSHGSGRRRPRSFFARCVLGEARCALFKVNVGPIHSREAACIAETAGRGPRRP